MIQNFIEILKNQTPYRKIFLIFLAFIMLIQTVGLVSYSSNLKNPKSLDPWRPVNSNSNVPLLARWDSGWYISIIKYGYYFNENKTSNAAFFPLYPTLILGASKILPIDYFYIGQYVSWLALLGSLIVFYNLLRIDYPDDFSFQSILYLLIYPWSFFLAAVYTESLFLFLSLASFYFARKKNWPAASIFGFFAALTRIGGILLLPALLYEFYKQNEPDPAPRAQGIRANFLRDNSAPLSAERSQLSARRSLRIHFESIIKKEAAWLALIPCGLAVFMFYLKLKTGYFLAFLYSQNSFGRSIKLPTSAVWTDLKNIIFFFRNEETAKALYYFLVLLTLALCLALLIKKIRGIRTSYLIFAFLSLLLPLFSGTIIAFGRFSLAIFPVFIAASMIQNKIFKYLWFAAGFASLAALTFYFVSWYFII